eukprot:CAMPEP_0171500054 /NCGR_PEP_ID=MMETSP0958-20121227/8768_1 /TAXON_ID=87120 /ORGANISM="Aurantiochytrium limacinum, Strain ATCCMYA-1381" /LENGTH=125 /DNA_ID=CAMNT_0012034673 /DNA_START=132 /DNA_END=509 /DNA_ORIENTATION=+
MVRVPLVGSGNVLELAETQLEEFTHAGLAILVEAAELTEPIAALASESGNARGHLGIHEEVRLGLLGHRGGLFDLDLLLLLIRHGYGFSTMKIFFSSSVECSSSDVFFVQRQGLGGSEESRRLLQ